MTIARTFVGLLLACASVACGGSRAVAGPSAPSQVSLAPQIAVFTDPASGFATSDVHDVDEQIVHFNSAGELLWMADGSRFRGYRVNRNVIVGPGPGGPNEWFGPLWTKGQRASRLPGLERGRLSLPGRAGHGL